MRSYELRVEANPRHLDLPTVTTQQGRVGRLDTAVRDHLHHLLGTDDVRVVLHEHDGGAAANAVIGARAGRGGAPLTLTLTLTATKTSPPAPTPPVPPVPTVRECLRLLEASALARIAGDRAESARLLDQARLANPELVLEVGRGIDDGTLPHLTSPLWPRYVEPPACRRKDRRAGPDGLRANQHHLLRRLRQRSPE